MPQKKAEEKIPAPRVSTSRVKASGPVIVESASAAPAVAKAKPAAKVSKAAKTTTSSATKATNSLLKLNGAINGGAKSETVAERAYFLWIEKGCPEGTAEQDWVEAERQLSAS